MLASDDTLGLQGGNVNARPHFFAFCILHFAQILQDHPMIFFFLDLIYLPKWQKVKIWEIKNKCM